MENPATIQHLTDRGYDGPATVTVKQTRLDEAWRSLQGELHSLVGWITTGLTDSEAAADVVSAAALRVLRNPEGVQEEASAIDDYRENRKRADSTEDIYFTAAELRRLTPAAATIPTAGSFKYS